MADQLSLRINLSSAQAADKLRAFNALLGAGDKSMASFNKALNGMATASNVATSDVKKTGDEVDKLGKKSKGASTAMTALGKGATTFGSTFTKSIGNSISGVLRLTRNVLALGAAIGGIGGIKLLTDYIDYSKSAGQLNAIVKGNGKTARSLENIGFKSTAGTGQNSGDVMESMKNVASTLEFDPTRGAKLPGGGYEKLNAGSAGYMANLKQIGDLTQRNAEFASSMDTSIGTVTDSMIKYAGVFGYDMRNMEDVIKVQDKFNALLNTSQGGLERLIPQISKFGQQYKNLGLSEDEALAVFSTLTNVFDPEEAGTRTLALGNWIQTNITKLDKITTDFGPKIGKQFTDALYNPDHSRKKMVDMMKNVSALMNSMPDQMASDIFGADALPEIRQASAFRTINSLMDKYDMTVKEIADDTGLSSKSIEAYWASSGAKLDLYFKSMQAGAESGIGAVVNILSTLGDPSKFNVKEFTDGIGELGAKLNYRLGAGASAPLAALRDGVLWLNTHREDVAKFAESMGKLARAVGAVGEFALNFVVSPPVQAVLDWAMSNPVIAIGGFAIGQAALAGVSAVLVSALSASLLAALGGSAATGGLGVAIAGAAVSGITVALASPEILAVLTGVFATAFVAGVATGVKEQDDKIKKAVGDDTVYGKESAKYNKEYPALAKRLENIDPKLAEYYDLKSKQAAKAEELRKWGLSDDYTGKFLSSFGVGKGADIANEYNAISKDLQDLYGGLNGRKGEGLTDSQKTFIADFQKDKINNVQDIINRYPSKAPGITAQVQTERVDRVNGYVGAVANPMNAIGSMVGNLMSNPGAIFEANIGKLAASAAKVIADIGATAADINTKINNPTLNISVPTFVTVNGVTGASTVSHGPTTNSAGNQGGGWVQNAAAQAQKFINKAQGKS